MWMELCFLVCSQKAPRTGRIGNGTRLRQKGLVGSDSMGFLRRHCASCHCSMSAMQTFTPRLWTTYLPRPPCVASRGIPRPFPGYDCARARVRPTRPFSVSASARAKKPPPPRSSASKAAKPTPKAPPSKAPVLWQSSATSATTARARGAFNPVLQRFAARASPQLLYQAPGMGVYVAGCYLIGAGCAAYVALNVWTVLAWRGRGLKAVVLVGYGGMLLFVAAFGVWVLRKVRGPRPDGDLFETRLGADFWGVRSHPAWCRRSAPCRCRAPRPS